MNDDLGDKSINIVSRKRNDNSILEQLEKVKKMKKMTTTLSSSVRVIKQARRLVRLRRFKVSILQKQQ